MTRDGDQQLDLFGRLRGAARERAGIVVGLRELPVRIVRSRRARRYILRLTPDGAVRATVPRGGSIREALAFAERSRAWIARQLERRAARPAVPRTWPSGAAVLYRGDTVTLTVRPDHTADLVEFADQVIAVPRGAADLRPAVERHLWALARPELTARTFELAAQQGVPASAPPAARSAVRGRWSVVRPLRVTVRNQRSKWGSCSPRRVISLNWRLVQAPPAVRDYIIIHELMHLREMNHSPRFWSLVARACPGYREAEAWLKQHRGLLG